MANRNEHRRNSLTIFIISLIAFSALAYVTTTPRPREEFFQLYLLGSNHKLGDYFPDNNPNISMGTTVRWYVGVANFMGSIQYVTIKFKLGNTSIDPPYNALSAPSPAPLLVEYPMVLLDNETLEFSFNWNIVTTTRVGDAVSLTLNMNGTKVEMPHPVNTGAKNFRMIMELWVYNTRTGTVEYGWITGSQRRTAWLQVWFNASLPGQ
jgi:hypothetical protein